MKIIFWGEIAPFETTQNMYTMAALLANRCPEHPIHMYRFRGVGEEYYDLYRSQGKLFRERKAYGSIEEPFDFYDCGSRQEKEVCRQMREADLNVFNMPQESRAWEWLLNQQMVRYENVIYLLSGYQEQNIMNRDFIERIYRVEKQKIGLIPYNNEFIHFTSQGKLTEFLERQIQRNEKNRLFMQELQRTATLLLRGMKRA